MSQPVLFLIDTTGAAGDRPFRQVDPAAPQINVMDLAVTRGDGIFEAAAVVDGRVQAFQAHLDRFAHSAQLMELPASDLSLWRAAIEAAVAAHHGAREAYVKFILTRGIEGSGVPTAWAYVDDAEDFGEERAGIAVVLLDRGYRSDVARTSPWLLQGAKTLSYAVNKAVLREARRRGADDVIFLSSDGYVLEGPTSSVVLRTGRHFVTPLLDQGILAGTTQASVFAFCEAQGYTTEYARVTPEDLANADGIWLVSSVRYAAPVRQIDGRAMAVDRDFTETLNAALLARTE